MIPLGAWLPDQPDFREQPSLIEANNVLPRPDGSYGPLPAVEVVSAALPGRCLGLVPTRSLAGGWSMFAATAEHLHQLRSDGSWLQVSKSGGYSLEVSDSERMEAVQFGSQLIAVMGVGDPLQYFVIDGGSQFADVPGAPRAKRIAIVRDFVMLANTWDESQGARPDQVWWCAIGNPLSWPAIGTAAAAAVQSDRQVLPDGGHLQGILPKIGGRDAAIFAEAGVWTCHYEGSPTIFRFDPVEGARGCYTPGSLVRAGTIAYYLATDGWYAFDGAQSINIGKGAVDAWFLAELDDAYRDNIASSYDPERGVLLWIFPGVGHQQGVPNKILAFEPVTARWSHGVLPVEMLASTASVGYSLEGLDSLGLPLDDLPFSLDSRVWAGGSPFTGLVDSVSHRLGSFGVRPLQADLVTNEFSGQNGSRIWIDGLRIYGDAAPVSAAVSWRDSGSGALTTTSYVEQDEDFIDQLVAARYARVPIRVPAGTSWTTLQGYDARMRAEGLR